MPKSPKLGIRPQTLLPPAAGGEAPGLPHSIR